MNIKKLILAAALAAGLAGGAPPVNAQQTNQTQTFSAFTLTARAPNLTASASSSRVALGAKAPVLVVCNTDAANVAYVLLGGSTVTVSATNGVLVRAGVCVNLNAASSTYLAGISASGAVLVGMLGTGSLQ